MPGPGSIGSTKSTTSHQHHQTEAPKAKKGRLGFRNLFPTPGNQLVQLARNFSGLKPGSTLISARQAKAQPPTGNTIPRSNAISAPNKQAALQQSTTKASDKSNQPTTSSKTSIAPQKKINSPRRPAPPPPVSKTETKETTKSKESSSLPRNTLTISQEPKAKGIKDFSSKEIDDLMDGLNLDDDAFEQLANDPDVLEYQRSHQSKRPQRPVRQPDPTLQTAQTPSPGKTSTPKTGKHSIDPKPEALRQLETENRKYSAKLQKEIENLPKPPTGAPKPSKKRSSPSRPMTGQEKARVLPGDYNRLSTYIENISTTKDLVETWNALTHLAIGGKISDLELSTLKGQFQNQLRVVARDSDQAEQITQKMIETMAEEPGKQKKIGIEIHEKKRSTKDLQARYRNLRR